MKYISTEELDRALGCAANAGKTNVVITLLESPYIPVDTMAWGVTPLYGAARKQNPVMIKALLQKGANPNARSPISQAPQPEALILGVPPDLGEIPLRTNIVEKRLRMLQLGGSIIEPYQHRIKKIF
jgi:ankyrin repeat protein